MIKIRNDQFRYRGENLRLAGSHTWDTVQSFGGRLRPLRQLVGNFTRLWSVEVPRVTLDGPQPWSTGRDAIVSPMPWRRVDGKFDLEKLNPAYFDRWEQVVKSTRRQGKVAGVVLFDGAFNRFFGADEWARHPLNPSNNAQGVGPSAVNLVHSRGPWNRYQKRVVRELVRRLEPFDNVIYEIANEPDRSSVTTGWQRKFVSFVQKLTDKPVGVSYVTRTSDEWMKRSGADWFAPASLGANISGLDGPVVADTDHASPLRSNVDGITGAFRNGQPVWLMDGLEGSVLRNVTSLQADRDFITGVAAPIDFGL